MASPQVSAETPSTRGRGGSASPPSEKSPLRFAIALLVTVSLAVGAHYAFCAVSAGQGSSDTARRFCGMGTSEPSAAVLNKAATRACHAMSDAGNSAAGVLHHLLEASVTTANALWHWLRDFAGRLSGAHTQR